MNARRSPFHVARCRIGWQIVKPCGKEWATRRQLQWHSPCRLKACAGTSYRRPCWRFGWLRFNRADMQVCERFSLVRKDVLLRVVDVWQTTFLSSRRASNRSRQVESLARLDLGHADRYPLSLVYLVVVGGGGLSGGGQMGGAKAQRSLVSV